MRYRFLLMLVIALAVFSPLPSALAQSNGDGSLDPDEIDAIAPSVVQILLLVDGEPQSTGSGTIADANGQIFTNRHVVAGGDDFIIYILEDVNERPVPRYRASVTHYAVDYDFAVLQIDRDLDGNPINPQNLNLPVFSGNTSSTPARRGDTLYVFGYPGVGDGYLVVTTGSVASVQNDEIILGETVPVWYQTDAEIAPGNSGGLAVNGNGEYIGIPTAVRSEERTGGRLSYILTFEAISDIIEASNKGEEGYLVSTNTAPEENASGPGDCPPLEYGDTVEATIGGETYILGFCLEAEQGDVISVEMNTTSGDLDGYLAIYDPTSDTILVENDDRSEELRDPMISNFEIPADGEYIIIAARYRFENGETSGDFELVISDSSGVVGGGDGPLGGLMGSGNASCASLVEGLNVPEAEIGSLSYGTSVESDITNSTTVAFYCFNAQAGDVIDVDMTTIGGDLDGLVAVYDPVN
ncbi:MAG: trypsin-like peptidase domain-containing protein, partial [Anaerolineae bacterium]|nr:trypsin-like peptidase domain-containing protein [Anaerolineae bacterium]